MISLEELDQQKLEDRESGYGWELKDENMEKVIGEIHILQCDQL